MPVYDFKCDCGHLQQDEFVHRYDDKVACDVCGKSMQRLFPTRVSIHCFPAEGIHLKHVCPGGKTFYSKTEMSAYAKVHDLELSALL